MLCLSADEKLKTPASYSQCLLMLFSPRQIYSLISNAFLSLSHQMGATL